MTETKILDGVKYYITDGYLKDYCVIEYRQLVPMYSDDVKNQITVKERPITWVMWLKYHNNQRTLFLNEAFSR